MHKRPYRQCKEVRRPETLPNTGARAAQVASQKMKGGNEALLTSLRGVLEAHPGIATSLVPPEHFAASEPY